MHDNALSFSHIITVFTSLNKTMTITVIALVAVIMGISAIAPAMAGVPGNPGPPEGVGPDCEKIIAGLRNAGFTDEEINAILAKIPGCPPIRP